MSDMLWALSSRDLLSYVLFEAREMLDRSPEQVGAAVGVSGRTIRRWENPDHTAQPRQTTLSAVASFYGLDAQFISELAAWEGSAEATLRWLRERAGQSGDEFAGRSDEAQQLAMQLARGTSRRVVVGGFGSGKTQAYLQQVASLAGDEDEAELSGLVEAFLRLDRRRRRLAMMLVQELQAAREAERAQPVG